MGCEKIIADLDSLWFFSNIFTSCSTCSNHHEEKITEPLLLLQETPTPKQANPRSPITESDQVEASDGKDAKDAKEKIEVSTKGEGNMHIVEADTMRRVGKLEVVKADQRGRVEKRSHKTSASKRRGKENIVQKNEFDEAMGFTYFGFNFAHIELDDCRLVYRFQGSRRNSYLRQRMPPLSDGMAMKEHLKSWAHAVACTVK